MKHDLNWKALKEEKVNISFNMGLEMAEGLSSVGRKCLIDKLKRNIRQKEDS